jgi:hypothetical protein
MEQLDPQQELNALIKETEKHREVLKNSEEKVENLQSAVGELNLRNQSKPNESN